MSTLTKQRSYDSFFSQRLKKSKEGTRQAYHYALGDFDKFCKTQFKKPLAFGIGAGVYLTKSRWKKD